MRKLLTLLRSRRLLWIPPVLVGVATLGYFVSRQRQLPRQEVPEFAMPIRVLEVQEQDITPHITGFGSAGPSRRWSAVAEVSGRVVEVNPQLDSGNSIASGELLLKIDPTDYQLRLRQRLSDLEVAQAAEEELLASQVADAQSLEIEQNLLAVSQKELDRQLGLVNQRVVSDSELETARMSLLMQKQAVQRLRNTLSLYPSKLSSRRAQVSLAESRVDEARRDLERTAIHSPLSGTLVGVSVEVGQVVSPNQNLFEVHDDSVVEIEAHFSIAQLDKVMPQGTDRYAQGDILKAWLPQLTAEVVVTSGTLKRPFVGRPIRITESIDAQTRTLGVVVEVENNVDMQLDSGEPPASMLRPGAFCEVVLRSQETRRGLAVPRGSLDGNAVYVIGEDDRLERRELELTGLFGELAVVSKGLRLGERIAAQPPVPAIDGGLVNPLPQDDNAKSVDALSTVGGAQ